MPVGARDGAQRHRAALVRVIGRLRNVRRTFLPGWAISGGAFPAMMGLSPFEAQVR